MHPEELFSSNLKLIDAVITGVCRRAGLRDADAEDFASAAKLALIENDYAILRSFEGRSSLGSFLTVVVQRLLSRERARMWGRWSPSADAERLGAAAVLLEKLLVRDRRPLEEAIPIVTALHPSLDRQSLRELAGRLPKRVERPRLVPIDDAIESDHAGTDRADAHARDAEARRVSARAGAVVRATLATLPLDQRMLMRFRFGAGLTIADAARLLGVPQRPLYRTIESLLKRLRTALEEEGIDAELAGEVISSSAAEGVDFGLNGKLDMNLRTEEMNGAQ